MWPLTVVPPACREAWIVTAAVILLKLRDSSMSEAISRICRSSLRKRSSLLCHLMAAQIYQYVSEGFPVICYYPQGIPYIGPPAEPEPEGGVPEGEPNPEEVPVG